MTLSFDAVVPELLTVLVTEPTALAITKGVVVRDLQGRIRLVAEPCGASESAVDVLENALTDALGKWYAGPLLWVDGAPVKRALARHLLEQGENKWPPAWPTSAKDPLSGKETALDMTRWGAVQRVMSKEAWLSDQQVRPPWPLKKQTPTIASFYSFKGGVGRSTLLGIVASLLAVRGEDVTIVDLDLEGPGQADLFDVSPVRGVLDIVLDHAVTGTVALDDALVDVTGEVQGAKGRMRLVPAGAPGMTFVEKLARLDYVAQDPAKPDRSPTGEALKALVKALRSDHKPTWILLDARSGIHDLGGLSLHALTHVDVLLSRGDPQGWNGLDLAVRTLQRRKHPDDLLTLVVQAQAPGPPSPPQYQAQARTAMSGRVFEIYKETLYAHLSDDDIPPEDDQDAPHFPLPAPHVFELTHLARLRDIDAAQRDSAPHKAIVDRLIQLSEPQP